MSEPRKQGEVEIAPGEPEETLRLLARMPAPEELTDRVHARLRQQLAEESARPGFWSFWLPGRRLQFAGAAALALAVGVSAWTVSQAHRGSGTPQVAPHANFGSAAAKRIPPTLKPILVPDRPTAPKKKPSATGLKAVSKVPASQTGNVGPEPRQ